MISFLAGILIKNREDTEDLTVRQKYGTLCSIVGIIFNILLFTGKFIAGLLSASIAVTADAFNNLSDAGSSVITLIGFRMAGQEPDPDHPFGHGRIEYISGLLVSVVILIMAFELLRSSFLKILAPEELMFSPVVVVILLVSIGVKGYMAFYNRKIGKLIHSAAMEATAKDSAGDMLATTAALIATLVSHFAGTEIDGYCGVIVGLFIGWQGICAARDTISPLLGQAPDPDLVRQIHELVLSHEGILGVHDLVIHNYGPGRTMISLHAEVPADASLLTVHNTIDAIEHELMKELKCHAVIHMDPVDVGDAEADKIKQLTQEYLIKLHPDITVHDFRLIREGGKTIVDFDIDAPYHFTMSDEAIITAVDRHIREQYPEYTTMIEVDHFKSEAE